MDNTTEAFFTAQFGKDLAKQTALGIAISVGTAIGLIAVGAGISKVKEYKAKKAQKTNPTD